MAPWGTATKGAALRSQHLTRPNSAKELQLANNAEREGSYNVGRLGCNMRPPCPRHRSPAYPAGHG